MTRNGLFALLGLLAIAPVAGAETLTVRHGGDLQAALNQARPGDVVALERGAVFTGAFVLPNTPGDRFITVRTAVTERDTALPGWRITPERSGPLAKIRSGGEQPALRTAPGAHHWRLELIEFQGSGEGTSAIIELGDGSSKQDTLAEVPREIVIDRCYIHGDPERGQKRGIGLNSASTTISGSYISDIKVVAQDSQAIAGWNGPGPFRIENNYLEAAGENFLLGGAEPGIRDLVPSDVEFVRNHVTRPENWRPKRWQVKNLFELKNARRVLVEGNIFETHWEAAQQGYAIVLTPSGQRGKAAWAVVEDITFRYNIVRDAAAGISLQGRDDGGPSGITRRITISHNLFYGLDRRKWGGNGFFLLIGDGPERVVVDHNTILQTGNVISAYGGSSKDPMPVRDFTFTNNLARHNANGVHGQGQSIGKGTLEAFFPDGVFAGNVLAGGRASRYPGGNEFPGEEEFEEQFVNYADGDFRLKEQSRFRSAGTDGKDLGADMSTLLRKTNGVLIGRPAGDGRRRR